jgi:subtilisin family serine protease
VVGVAPEAELYALKVLGANGSGSYSAVIAALQWAVDNHIQVTNNSYGSSGDPGSTVKAAFDNAEKAGLLNVCAAGNSGNSRGTRDNVIYPARYDSCIAVAATDSSDNRASWSSTGPAVELAAPGVSIYSTLLGGSYGMMSGTSMACPHVAGTAALVIAAGITDVRTQLQRTADDLGSPGRDTWYGFGLVDADEAAGVSPPPPPPGGQLTVSVSTDKPTYRNGQTVTITVKVTDGTNPVAGANVHVDITTANNSKVDLGDKTSDVNGVVTFKYKVNRWAHGVGLYTVNAKASKAGYESGTGSCTFEVNR